MTSISVRLFISDGMVEHFGPGPEFFDMVLFNTRHSPHYDLARPLHHLPVAVLQEGNPGGNSETRKRCHLNEVAKPVAGNKKKKKQQGDDPGQERNTAVEEVRSAPQIEQQQQQPSPPERERFRVISASIEQNPTGDGLIVTPNLPTSSKAERTAVVKFFNTILQPWKLCDCCKARRPVDRLKSPATLAQLRLHHLEGTAEKKVKDFLLCARCLRFKVSEKENRETCPFHPSNSLATNPVDELTDLSAMEKHLIRRAHPFQVLNILPQGQQGARGQVIHFPSSPADNFLTLLPAKPEDTLLVNYEKPNGQSSYLEVRVDVLQRALQKLSEINPRYRDVEIRSLENIQAMYGTTEETPTVSSASSLPFTESMVLNMSGTEDSHRTLPLNESPPLSRSAEHLEADCYPHLFPQGVGDETDPDRPMRLDTREYITTRLLSYPEFQKDPSWPFRALISLCQNYMSRAVRFVQQQMLPANAGPVAPNTAAASLAAASSAADAVRASTPQVTASQVLELMTEDDFTADAEFILGKGYWTVGQNLRGTSMYWQTVRKHVHAMVNTLGPPTFFITLSADDMHWFDVFHTVDPSRFRNEDDVAALSFEDRVKILNSYPAIIAEHLSNRFQAIIAFMKSPAQPLGGKVVQLFFRVEFQKRGTPHLHGIVWVEGAPSAAKNPEEYLRFVDKVVRAEVPEDDEDLAALVRRYQKHIHTYTCHTKKQTPEAGAQQQQQQQQQHQDNRKPFVFYNNKK